MRCREGPFGFVSLLVLLTIYIRSRFLSSLLFLCDNEMWRTLVSIGLVSGGLAFAICIFYFYYFVPLERPVSRNFEREESRVGRT